MITLLAGIGLSFLLVAMSILAIMVIMVILDRAETRKERPHLSPHGEKCRVEDAPQGPVFDGKRIYYNLAAPREHWPALEAMGLFEHVDPDMIVQPLQIFSTQKTLPAKWVKDFYGEEAP